MTTPYCVAFITCSNQKEAQKISQTLLKKKLAACVNTVPKVFSRYWWKGKIENASESLLVIKTTKALLPKTIREIKSVHSYTVPEIIALPIIDGNSDYLNWIEESIGQ